MVKVSEESIVTAINRCYGYAVCGAAECVDKGTNGQNEVEKRSIGCVGARLVRLALL